MSIANIEHELQNAVMSPGTGAAPNITSVDENGDAMTAYGNGVPTVVQGYAPGCAYANQALTGIADARYINLGTALVANWTVLTVA